MYHYLDARWLLAAVVAVALAAPAHADPIGPNLVSNGDFEQVTMPGGPSQMNTTNVSNWTTTGYNFLYFPGSQATGSYTPQFNGNVALWSPGNGAANGFTNSPTGGNFVGADGAFESAPISQTLQNLHIGDNYAVTFSWAAAQQYNFSGATTEAWQVSLGGQSQTTTAFQLANHGFSGWMQQTFTFTASATSEVLSFLALGSPAGEPPFSLLDGVSAFDVPEPAAWAVLAAGMAGLAMMRRRGRNGCAA